MAQRAFSHSWVSSLPETLASDNMFTQGTQFSSENISCTTEIGSAAIQFCSNNELQQEASAANCFSAFNIPSNYKPINIPTVLSKPASMFPLSNEDLPNGFTFSSLEASGPTKCTVDTGSMFLNPALIGHISNASESIDSQGRPQQQQFSGFSISMPQEMQENMGTGEDYEAAGGLIRKNSNDEWGTIRSIGFPFSLPSNDAWIKPNLPWDSPPCPSEMSTSYSTNTCYT
ncbi:hypothetical protein FH972_007544 [Carpinus fangiana]|uniref:Uncharacterized protein n=1 Tax=Carpinus fangiana TaxID=176857 RepID=A0A5N6QVT5_9ROSI|nr:hypothetical protein FH972_007544 [Carpinus fangiana]